MREILFRGKRVDNREWIYGYPMIDTAPCSLKAEGKCVCPHDGSNAQMFFWDDELHEYDSVDVIPETVGQDTGLPEEKGNKVFEGDCIQDIFCDSIGVIRYGKYWQPFNDDNFTFHVGFYVDWVSGERKEMLRKDLGYWINRAEIIGNIHDNPELLEEHK